MWEHARSKVIAGLTTFEEARRKVLMDE